MQRITSDPSDLRRRHVERIRESAAEPGGNHRQSRVLRYREALVEEKVGIVTGGRLGSSSVTRVFAEQCMQRRFRSRRPSVAEEKISPTANRIGHVAFQVPDEGGFVGRR
jgi:hypothetical protein